MNLFNLVATLALNKQAYEQGLNAAGKDASSFSSKAGTAFKAVGKAVMAVTALIGVAASAIKNLVSNTINYGDEVDKQSQKLGLSADAYQKWSLAAQMAGTDAATLQTGIRQLTKFTQDLTDGTGDSLLALQELGIGYDDFMNASPDEQLKMVVEAMQGLEEGTKKTELAQQLFGQRAYQELMPLLNQEKGSIDELFASFDDLGLIMSDDMVKKSAELNDKMTILTATFNALKNKIGVDLYPEVENLIDGMQDIVNGNFDEGIDKIGDAISGLVNKITDNLPKIIDGAGKLLVKIITGIADKVKDPEFVQSIVKVLTTLLTTAINLIPTLLSAGTDLILNLVDALMNIDWVSLATAIIDALIKVLTDDLPRLILGLIEKIIYWITHPGEILTSVTDMGKKFGESIFDGLKNIGKNVIDFFKNIGEQVANFFEGIFDNVKNLFSGGGFLGFDVNTNFGDGYAGGGFGGGGGGRRASGGMFSGVGSMYIAGEAGAEIVSTGRYGTGVTNVKQIQEAMYNALADIAPVLVNGIVGGVNMQGGRDMPRQFILKLGEKEFKSYVVRASNDNLNQKGRQSLNKVTRY